jgi:hypothetical protein
MDWLSELLVCRLVKDWPVEDVIKTRDILPPKMVTVLQQVNG